MEAPKIKFINILKEHMYMNRAKTKTKLNPNFSNLNSNLFNLI